VHSVQLTSATTQKPKAALLRRSAFGSGVAGVISKNETPEIFGK